MNATAMRFSLPKIMISLNYNRIRDLNIIESVTRFNYHKSAKENTLR